jgi:signal peptidase
MTAPHRTAVVARVVVDAALVGLVVAVLAAIAVAKLPELGGGRTFVVAGASMEPAIGQGAAVVVDPVAPERIGVGDIITLRVQPRGTLFTHRVMRVVESERGLAFETKGDASPASDPTLVPADWIVGRAVVILPLIGYLIAVLSIPSGVVFVLGLGATLLVLAWLIESLEGRGAARGADRPPRADGPMLRPSPDRSAHPVRSFIEAGLASVRRMVPDGRRSGWRAARSAKPGRG